MASVLQALTLPLHAAALRIQLAGSHSITAAQPVACAAKHAGSPKRLPPSLGLGGVQRHVRANLACQRSA